jgi:uncharacterized membrane protein YgcG
MGSDYIYPSNQEIDYYASQGMTVIRVPFLAERLENNPNGPLSQQDLSQLQSVVSYAATKGIDVDLDMHNYGTVWGQEILPGSSTEQAYDNLWGQLATAFKSDPNVIFGLMNEPNTQTPTQQATIDNDAIAAIRQTGASQEVFVPGTDWTGGWTWVSSGNAAAINPQTIHDPDNNWAIEVHQYLDSDGSGTNFGPITDPNIGVERLTSVTQWAQQNGVKLFLGETGVPSDGQSLTALQNMLSYMEQNSSVWQGVAYWAGGQWWGSYPFSIEPSGLGTSNVQNAPQMNILNQFAPGGDLATGYVPSGGSGGSGSGSGGTSGGGSGGSSGGGSSGGGSGGGASFTPSSNDTVITAGSGGSITDANGNVWTITTSGSIDIDSTPAGYSANVIELAYVNGNVWQENSSNLWWEWQNSSWQPGAGTSQSPLPASGGSSGGGSGGSGSTPSPSDTVITASGGGSITDANGNVWTITNSGTIDMNGTPAGYSANVIELANVNGNIWQENSSNLWWEWQNNTWQPGAGTSQSPLPAGATPITVSNAAAGSGMSFIYNTGSAETAPAPSSSSPIIYEVDSGGTGVLTISDFRLVELGAGVTITSQTFSTGVIDLHLSNQGQVLLHHS